ncbi:unnamed protein product, partial [Oppiella nova]
MYQPIMNQQIIPKSRPPVAPKLSPRKGTNPNLKKVPIVRSPGAQSSAKRGNEKKDDKLINPYDLLLAERTKLRAELSRATKSYEQKVENQNLIVARDGGTDSYAYKQLDKSIKELQTEIESINGKILKNKELIDKIQKSKANAKHFLDKIKSTGDISKIEPKQKDKPKTSADKKAPQKSPKSGKDAEVITIDDDEEEEKNSRFHYFDSGPHWCKCCDKFSDNMKQYFAHIHTKDHQNKQKASERTPWITKDYIKNFEKVNTKSKDNKLVVASK